MVGFNVFLFTTQNMKEKKTKKVFYNRQTALYTVSLSFFISYGVDSLLVISLRVLVVFCNTLMRSADGELTEEGPIRARPLSCEPR